MKKKSSSAGILKHYLKRCSREEMAKDIIDLFNRFEPVRDFYQARLGAENEADVAEKYKAVIRNEFFPARGFGRAKISVARKAVSDFRKVCRDKTWLADIMIFYDETGVEFTNTYGDIDEPFYNSMESMYGKAVKFIVENQLQDVFEGRCRRIVYDTSEMGWGFHDTLSEIYGEHFEGGSALDSASA